MMAVLDWLADTAIFVYLRSLPDSYILYFVIGFSVLHFLWEEFLCARQRNVLHSVQHVPPDLADSISRDTFEKARIYNIDKSLFGSCQRFFQIVLSTAFLLCNIMPVMWNLAGHSLRWADMSGELYQSGLFVLYSSLLSMLLGMPWTLYSTFVVEERHGFNKQTLGFFAKDKLKGFVLSQLISVPMACTVVYIVQWGGDYFFLYLWLFCFCVLLCLMTIYPAFIAPLFDKYTPLPEGELHRMIQQLADKLNFPLKKLYVVEGSKRSAHSNAYFYGFFNNKRIVLFDTLLENWEKPDKNSSEKTEEKEHEKTEEKEHEKTEEEEHKTAQDNGDRKAKKKGCSNEEIVAVLSHELGHWSMNHVLKNIVIIQTNLLLTFVVFAALFRYQPLYRAFGFVSAQPVLIGLIVILQHVLAPYSTLFGVFVIMISRRFEFQADQFGKRLGYGSLLKAALVKLTADNLSFPVYDTLYSSWHHSHPPLLERIAALQKTD